MAFYTEEYKHLLSAQRVLSKAIDKEDGKLSELSQCARALVDIVRLKRDIRQVPDPRPVDVSRVKRKSSKSSQAHAEPTEPLPPGESPV